MCFTRFGFYVLIYIMIDPFYISVEKFGNRLLYRGYDDKGKRVKERVAYKPTLYLEAKKKASKYKALDGTAVEPIGFPSMKECSEYIQMYKDVPGYKIYGNDRHVTSFIRDLYPSEIRFEKNLIDIATLDIETESNDGFPEPEEARHEILTIALKSRQGCHVWGMKDYDPSLNKKSKYEITYHHFKTEQALLTDFINWFSDENNIPDVITGWNTRFFDLPYMVNRIVRVLGDEYAKKLSPWNMVNIENTSVMGQKRLDVDLVGLPCLDYLELFKKFALNTYGQQESYKLDYIAELVLGEKKVDYSEYGSLHSLYENNFQLFVDYNIQDVELVDRLEEKMGMISLVFTLAYKGGVNYYDTLGTTAIWDTIIFRHLANKNVIIPPSTRNTSTSFAGGYVKEVMVGMHNWVMSFDLNSLYPNIIVQWNMSPETLVPHMKVPSMSVEHFMQSVGSQAPNDNLTIAANGSVYRKDIKGVVPELVEVLYSERVTFKKEMLAAKQRLENTQVGDSSKRYALEKEIDRLNTMQTAVKILMNSLYGAMGSKYFRYYNVEIAEGVTLSGQLVNQWAEKHLNSWVSNLLKDEKDRVIAMDTDSLYIGVEDIINKFKPKNPVKFLDEFADKGIEPVLEKAFDELYGMTNGYVKRMSMKREAIADRGIWVAKKRYILNVHNNEGVQYSEPKIKVVGIESVKSSTPKVCRSALKDVFKNIMTKTEEETQQGIASFKQKFFSLPAHEIAFPRNIRDLKSYASTSSIYVSGKDGKCPIHCRASLLYNWKVKSLGLERECKLIRGGDKIKFVYLKKPNTLRNENVVAFIDELPSKLDLDSKIDYDTQFEKTFIAPLEHIFDAIKWKIEPTSSLDTFFC